jgi:plastocyanin
MKILFLSLVTVVTISSSYSAEINIYQVDKVFLKGITEEQAGQVFEDETIEENFKVEEISLKVGDKINFLNRDDARHNVNGKVDGEKIFDVKIQNPGKENDKTIELKRKGEYEIKCMIHPKMKIKLKVN